MADAKEVKRLEPTKETIRELFVKSGNECAFPGCGHRIINQEGVFIAQACHIEAADEKGPRFNKAMSNEDRRQFANLMLMCHAHHKITDDVELYPVPVLQKMKRKHEATYTLAAETIYEAIVDEATRVMPTKPKCLARFDAVFEHDYDAEVNESCSREIAKLVTRLQKLPRRTRELLVSIVRRCEEASFGNGYGWLPFIEVVHACNLTEREVYEQLKILERYRIAEYDTHPSDETDMILLWCIGEDGTWDFWASLRAFCEKTSHTLEEFIIDLRFDLLD